MKLLTGVLHSGGLAGSDAGAASGADVAGTSLVSGGVAFLGDRFFDPPEAAAALSVTLGCLAEDLAGG